MNYQIHLSKRLSEISSFIPKDCMIADIGSDHAYLPSYICMRDDKARAIAGEINEGPLEKVKETICLYQLQNCVIPKLGDGLAVLDGEDDIELVVIAGMGGNLISTILSNGKNYLKNINRIITQPNINEKRVREWFLVNGYHLVAEKVIEENNHYYEILVADKGVNDTLYSHEYKQRELLFGPYLMEEKTTCFKRKWKQELEKLKHLIEQMRQATHPDETKINEYRQMCHWIEEVLKGEKRN